MVNVLRESNDLDASFEELMGHLRAFYQKWKDYESVLESHSSLFSSQISVSRVSTAGRPKFAISKDQLVYLSSLSFKWTEIAALLGVSRMTLFRLVYTIGLIGFLVLKGFSLPMQRFERCIVIKPHHPPLPLGGYEIFPTG